eukprot:287737_1
MNVQHGIDNFTKRILKHQMLWDRTYLNNNNPCNVYLYIPRKNSSSTRPISVKLSQYLPTLSKHDISWQSLNIPLVCPTFEDQRMNQTASTLWNIIETQREILKHSTVNRDINVNQSINNKLDWIMNAFSGSNNGNQVKQLQSENKLLKSQLMQKNMQMLGQNIQINRLNQTLLNAQQTIKQQTQENEKLNMEKTRVIKNRYYWKKTATERRQKMKFVGLTYTGNIWSQCSQATLRKRMYFLQNYMFTMYNINEKFTNELLRNYILKNPCVNR